MNIHELIVQQLMNIQRVSCGRAIHVNALFRRMRDLFGGCIFVARDDAAGWRSSVLPQLGFFNWIWVFSLVLLGA